MSITQKHIPTGGRKIFLGDTFRISLVVEKDGSPKDLTGASVDFTVETYFGGTTIYKKTDEDSAVVISNPEDGEIVFTVDTAEFENVTITESDTYEYRVRVSDMAGNFVTVAVGAIEIWDNNIGDTE